MKQQKKPPQPWRDRLKAIKTKQLLSTLKKTTK